MAGCKIDPIAGTFYCDCSSLAENSIILVYFLKVKCFTFFFTTFLGCAPQILFLLLSLFFHQRCAVVEHTAGRWQIKRSSTLPLASSWDYFWIRNLGCQVQFQDCVFDLTEELLHSRTGLQPQSVWSVLRWNQNKTCWAQWKLPFKKAITRDI